MESTDKYGDTSILSGDREYSPVSHDVVYALTWQVTTEDLHPHANSSRRPPLGKNSDVLGYYLIKASHLWRIIVAVSLKNLSEKKNNRVVDVLLLL